MFFLKYLVFQLFPPLFSVICYKIYVFLSTLIYCGLCNCFISPYTMYPTQKLKTNKQTNKLPCSWQKATLQIKTIQGTSCCSFSQLCPPLCNPMDCSMPGFPVLHLLPGFAQTHVHLVADAIQPSHPLSPSSPPALNLSQHQGLFQWISPLHHKTKETSASILPINIQG